MLDDGDARARGDHDALGGQRAVGDLRPDRVQHRHRGHQLPEQAQGGIDVEGDVRAVGERQQLGEPHAGRHVGHERQRR